MISHWVLAFGLGLIISSGGQAKAASGLPLEYVQVQWTDLREDLPYLSPGQLNHDVANKLYAPFMDDVLDFRRESASLYLRQIIIGGMHSPNLVLKEPRQVHKSATELITLNAIYFSPLLTKTKEGGIKRLSCLRLIWEADHGKELSLSQLAQTTTHLIYARRLPSKPGPRRYEVFAVREMSVAYGDEDQAEKEEDEEKAETGPEADSAKALK